jgi:cytosine/adenosine deaminase-related metal-dependent hydrolase
VIYRARWVLPIDRPPIAGGWIETQAAGGAVNVDERITRMGGGQPPAVAEDLGDVALMPGLVNAHTHLELAWMAGLVPPAGSMEEWIRTLLAVRRAGPSGGEAEVRTAMTQAAEEMRETGTVLVGDISNSLVSPSVLIAAGIGGVVFHELLGFAQSDAVAAVRDAWLRVEAQPAGLRYSVVAHAPYSVSPALFAEIARRAGDAPLSVHLGESAEEVEFLRTGRGPFRTLLETLGVWTDDWRIPACEPVTYMADLGYLVEGALLVHGVHLTDDGLERIRLAKAVLVTCPRSNLWVGAGPPRLSHFFASGAPVAIGTDSLASAPTLNMFDELAEMRRLAPELAAPTLLQSATLRGAVALGFGREYGTLAPGKRAALVSVDVPPAERDVEEYLVSGVSAGAIRRVA